VHLDRGGRLFHRPDDDIVTQVRPASAFSAGIDTTNSIAAIVLLGISTLLWWLGATHATILPFWAPWDFSWLQFLTIWLTAWWYLRGLIVSTREDRFHRRHTGDLYGRANPFRVSCRTHVLP
jgi:hypothetical protein